MREQPFPQRNYTPLLIASIPRSGTNLLSSLLSNHPDILIHGEVFNPNERARNYAPQWQDRTCVPYASGSFQAHLEKHVFPPDVGGLRVIGFKLFPLDFRFAPEGRREIERMMRSIPGLKIILLERENLLDIALSKAIAKRDDIWVSFNKANATPPEPLTISPEEFLTEMESLHTHQGDVKRIVRDCDVLRITYNDLLYRTDDVMREIQEWLHIDVRALHPNSSIRKQRTQSRQNMLQNFAAVRKFCAKLHPEWLHFFTEPEQLHEVKHPPLSQTFSIVPRKKPIPATVAPSNIPTFYLQLYHDAELAKHCLQHVRNMYPYARVVLQSDGDNNPEYTDISKRYRCEYFPGERLYLFEHGGRMIQRMFNAYLNEPGDWLIKIDTDTRIDRRFNNLPTGIAVYGSPLRQGPPQGGCVIIPRKVAQMLRDSRVLLSPLLKNPVSSWGSSMAPPFLRERIESTGCIGFEWTLYWSCMQLGIPVLRHPEIFSTWKQGHINNRREFAVVHPDKFINVADKSVHDLCTLSHAGIHTVWLDAIAHAV
jgi:LPS sulfotransferase NodH